MMKGCGVKFGLAAGIVLFLFCAPAFGGVQDLERVRIKMKEAGVGTRHERNQALEELSAIDDPARLREAGVIPFLIEMLKDKDDNPRIRRQVAGMLGRYGRGLDRAVKSEAREALVDVLLDKPDMVIVRVQAAHQLGRMLVPGETDDAAAVNALIRTASAGRMEAPPEVQSAALLALGEIADPKARNVIIDKFRSSDSMVRDAAIEAYSKALMSRRAEGFVDSMATRKLVGMLADPTLSADVRRMVIDSFPRIVKAGGRVEGVTKPLAKIIREEESVYPVVMAVRAVGLIGERGSADPLEEAYDRFKEKQGEDVRWHACQSAGEIFPLWARRGDFRSYVGEASRLSRFLINALLSDSSEKVREAAAIALGNMYSRKYDKTDAVAALIAMLAEEGVEATVKKAALDSLEVLTGRALGMDAERWKDWFRSHKDRLRPRVRY